MRLQMRRDRQKATQAKVAAAKKQQKEDEEGPGLTPEEEDSLFLFEVGAKKPKGPAGMVDVAVGYGGATQGAPKAANTDSEIISQTQDYNRTDRAPAQNLVNHTTTIDTVTMAPPNQTSTATHQAVETTTTR